MADIPADAVRLLEPFELGLRVARGRRRAKISQAAFAQKLGVSRKTISDLERILRSHRDPRILTKTLIEKALKKGGGDNVTVQLLRYAPRQAARTVLAALLGCVMGAAAGVFGLLALQHNLRPVAHAGEPPQEDRLRSALDTGVSHASDANKKSNNKANSSIPTPARTAESNAAPQDGTTIAAKRTATDSPSSPPAASLPER